MKFLTNKEAQPLLQTKDGQIINLNSLEFVNTNNVFPVKAGKETYMSVSKNNNFLDKAGRVFKVSKLFKMQGVAYYALAAHIKLFCIITNEDVRLIGNYPIHYLKLLYRYINAL